MVAARGSVPERALRERRERRGAPCGQGSHLHSRCSCRLRSRAVPGMGARHSARPRAVGDLVEAVTPECGTAYVTGALHVIFALSPAPRSLARLAAEHGILARGTELSAAVGAPDHRKRRRIARLPRGARLPAARPAVIVAFHIPVPARLPVLPGDRAAAAAGAQGCLSCRLAGSHHATPPAAAHLVIDVVAALAQFPVVFAVTGIRASLDQGVFSAGTLRPALVADARLGVMAAQVGVKGIIADVIALVRVAAPERENLPLDDAARRDGLPGDRRGLPAAAGAEYLLNGNPLSFVSGLT